MSANLKIPVETTIDEIRDETSVMHEGVLQKSEGMKLSLFSKAYGLLTRVRRRPFVSEVLRLDHEETRGLQKKEMALHGLSREEAGGFRLPQIEMDAFCRRGVVGPIETGLSPQLISQAREICGDALEIYPHLCHQELMRIALRPEIVGAVTSILGDDVDVVRSSIFIKEAGGKSKPSCWHMAPSSNYGAMERVDCTDFVTVWIALTPARIEHGCLKIIPGSFSIYPNDLITRVADMDLYLDNPMDAFLAMAIKRKLRKKNTGIEQASTPFQAFISDRVNASIIFQKILSTNDFLYDSLRQKGLAAEALEARPGECFIFTSENYHGSFPHVADETRVAFVVRYGRPSCPMDRTENVKTLVDLLPQNIKDKLRHPETGQYLTPLVRAHGTPKLGREGNTLYLEPEQIA